MAVVDSGCDASHPDLADHVVHNVKLYSGEYANQPATRARRSSSPNETGPYQNTDIGSGHGTHVAGIVAADSTTDPSGGRLGVAPGRRASSATRSARSLFVTAAVTAYDHLLDQPDLWGVDVINNSWGNSFQQFDPRDPVAVATKAVADLGVVVVFAAGNSGYSETEMSLNPFSQAPWVISVAASNVADATTNRADFSSNGLIFDNSQAVTIGAGGHTVFTGDRIGIYHPDVDRTRRRRSPRPARTAGTIVPACPPPDYTNAEAGGHVDGLAARRRRRGAPAPGQPESHARPGAHGPPVDRRRRWPGVGDGPRAPFWQVGYGHVDLAAAIAAVKARTGRRTSRRPRRPPTPASSPRTASRP